MGAGLLEGKHYYWASSGYATGAKSQLCAVHEREEGARSHAFLARSAPNGPAAVKSQCALRTTSGVEAVMENVE